MSVLPILLSGEKHYSFPPLIAGRVYADFKNSSNYFIELMKLVVTIYCLPFDEPIIRDIFKLLKEEANLHFK